MKSTDRKQTLLHYLVKVIAEKYPQLTGFHSDLHFLDKAGSGMGGGRIQVGREPGELRMSWDGNAASLILCFSTVPLSVPGQRAGGCPLPAARPGVDPA